MSLIKTLYRTIIPETIRWQILHAKKRRHENKLKQNILNYYKAHPTNDSEINNALHFLKTNTISVFPYDFSINYKNKTIEVQTDTKNGLPYVLHYNKKLYFKKSWSKDRVLDSYRFLLMEQDDQSAHCYLTPSYTIDNNSMVVDIGAAEGIFALHKIETIKHLYLIETDLEWIEALKETYKPWADKITIINKFVSNKDDERNLKLDTYFKSIEKIDFLKIDVDGAEQDLINGAEQTISEKVNKLAICVYHKPHDNRDFSKYLLEKKFSITNSNGYMLFYFDSTFEPPFFRRGLIRATK